MSELTRLRSRTSDPAEADALLAASGGRFAFASEPDAGFFFDVDQIVDPSFSVARYTIGGEWETSGEFEDLCIVNVTSGSYDWEIDGMRASATRAPFLIRPGHDFTCEAERSDIVNIYLSPATLRDVARTTFGDEHLEVVFDSPSTIGPEHSEYMLTAATVATGVAGGEDGHEAIAYGLLGLIAVHVVAVIAMSILGKENLIRAMVTGRKPADLHPDAHDAQPPAGLAAPLAALVVGGAAFAATRVDPQAFVPSIRAESGEHEGGERGEQGEGAEHDED